MFLCNIWNSWYTWLHKYQLGQEGNVVCPTCQPHASNASLSNIYMLRCALEWHAGDDFLKKPTNNFWMTTKMRKLGLVHGQFMNRKRDEISWMNCSLCIIQPAVLISALRTVPVPTAANSKTPFDFSGSRTEPSENGLVPASSAVSSSPPSFTIAY